MLQTSDVAEGSRKCDHVSNICGTMFVQVDTSSRGSLPWEHATLRAHHSLSILPGFALFKCSGGGLALVRNFQIM